MQGISSVAQVKLLSVFYFVRIKIRKRFYGAENQPTFRLALVPALILHVVVGSFLSVSHQNFTEFAQVNFRVSCVCLFWNRALRLFFQA